MCHVLALNEAVNEITMEITIRLNAILMEFVLPHSVLHQISDYNGQIA